LHPFSDREAKFVKDSSRFLCSSVNFVMLIVSSCSSSTSSGANSSTYSSIASKTAFFELDINIYKILNKINLR